MDELKRVKSFSKVQAQGFIVGNLVANKIRNGYEEDMAIKIANAVVDKLLGAPSVTIQIEKPLD